MCQFYSLIALLERIILWIKSLLTAMKSHTIIHNYHSNSSKHAQEADPIEAQQAA